AVAARIHLHACRERAGLEFDVAVAGGPRGIEAIHQDAVFGAGRGVDAFAVRARRQAIPSLPDGHALDDRSRLRIKHRDEMFGVAVAHYQEVAATRKGQKTQRESAYFELPAGGREGPAVREKVSAAGEIAGRLSRTDAGALRVATSEHERGVISVGEDFGAGESRFVAELVHGR